MDSKKKTSRLPMIAVGAAAVTAVILGMYLAGNAGKKNTNVTANLAAEQQQVFNTGMLLHAQFSRIQQLEEEYTVRVFNNTVKDSLLDMATAITQAEGQLQERIDSVRKTMRSYNAWSNVLLLDSMTSSFTRALANRRYLATIRDHVMNNHRDVPPADRHVTELQREIVTLRQALKASVDGADKTGAPEQKKPELQEVEERMTGLTEVVHKLREENQQLKTDAKRNITQRTENSKALSAARSRAQQLQEEIEELNAEVNFARIDCSMSRADANKIISNGRQRKELLDAALKNLQLLSGSSNENVQRRAKEKIAQLTRVANMIRD